MRVYGTKVVIIFALFCANSVIRAGTQRHAEGLQDAANASDEPDRSEADLTELSSVALPHSTFIDSGQTAPTKSAIVKRAPSGFMGMRGKKLSYDVSGVSGGNWDEMSYPPRLQLVSPFDEYYEGDDVYSESVAPLMSKRAPSGFMGMRGKKNNALLNELQLLEYIREAAASVAAARRVEDDDGVDDELANVKRAPGAGFLGMRGKRNPRLSATGDYDESDESSAEQHGVIGSAGFKRAPAIGFMGMRGKKAPGVFNFFGTRGKKVPVDFRGKFVAVRGKKVPGGVAVREFVRAFHGGEYAMPELQSAPSDAESGKRAPSGFHGMRGKKWLAGDESLYD